MKLLHIADPHLDLRPQYDRPDVETGIPSRTLDVGRAWIRAAEIAVDEAVDLVVVAGDVFHTANPTAVSENFFRDGLRDLESAGIPVVAIPGNHDRAPHPGQRSILEIFDDRPRVFVASKPEVLDVDGIRVACLPNVSPKQLQAMHPEYSAAETTETMTEALIRTLGMLRAEGADVLTGHWSVSGTILDNGRDMAQIGENEIVIPQAELEGPWAYIAFGHIHKAQEHVIGRSLFAYAGSIDRMNFGESHEPSVVIASADKDFPGHRRVPLPARRFVTLAGTDVLEGNDVLENLDGGQAGDLEGAIVRFRLPADLRHEAAKLTQAAYAAGAHMVKVEVDNVRTIAPRSAAIAHAKDRDEALEGWFELKGIPEFERAVLRDLAKQLFEAIA